MPDRKRLITLRPKGTGGIVPPTPLGEPIQTKPQLGKPLPLKTPPPQSREGVALYEPPGIEPPNEWLEAQLIELQDVAWKPRWEEIKKRADTTGYNIPDEVKDEKTFMDKWRSAGEQVIESPVMQVLGTVAGIALIVYGGYATATTGWRAFINSSLWRNINSYEKSVQKGNPKFSIPPETKNNFVTWAEQNLGKRWLTKNSIKTLFKPVQTGLRVPQEVAQQAESDVTALVKTKLPTFIPRGTQTGAMAMGGLPKPVPSGGVPIVPPTAPLAPETAIKPPVTPSEAVTPTEITRGIPVEIQKAADEWRVAEKLKRQALRQDPQLVSERTELAEQARVDFEGLVNQSNITKEQYDSLVRQATITQTEQETAVTPTPVGEGGVGEVLYHGSRTSYTGVPRGEIAYLSPSKGRAETYGGNIREFTLSPESKILKYQDLPQEIRNTVTAKNKKAIQYAKDNGYDGVEIIGESGTDIAVWNKNVLTQPTVTPEVTPTAPKIEPIGEVSEGITPQEAVKGAEISPEVSPSEEAAVTEVAGAPPKPPKDWDKLGERLYDNFKERTSVPTPNTVPLSARLKKAKGKLEKFSTDEFANLNKLGWQVELDVAMIRASGSKSAQLYRETMKSINKSLGGNSELLSYVDDYLMLRHQLEVLKATGRKYFVVKKGDTTRRFTAKQIGLIFYQMKKELGAEDYAKVKEAASHVPALYNNILRGTQELTPEQIEGLIRKFPWYNPVLFKSDTVPVDIARKLQPSQVKALTMLEADAEQLSPLLSLPTIIAKRLRAQAINDARKSIAELAVEPKNAAFIGGDVEIVTKKPEGAFIDFFENGERKYLKLGEGAEWIAKDIEMFQRQPPNMVLTMVRSLQNLSKMFFTTYNPGFMAWNTTFDAFTSYFTEGISPFAFGKALAGNIKAMFVDVPSVNEFRRSGGELFGFFEKGSREGLGFGEKEKALDPFISRKNGQLRLRSPESLKRFINPFTLIRELGVAGENAARRATYEKALKEGVSEKEATLRARRVTVDFSRFSQASRVINDLFIYFNPAMQGFLLPGRAIAKNPRSLWRLSLLISAYVGLVIYNQSYDEYDDVRDADKSGKLLVMLPSDEYNKYGQKVPHYITVAPLREFAMFTAPIEYLLGRLKTEEPEAYRTIGQEWGTLYPIVSPLSMISETGGLGFGKLVYPTQIAATVQQIATNHDDFRNKPIIDDEMSLLPTSQQYDPYTNSLAIRVGQALNMSPKKLDFFISSMFGTMGDDILRTLDLAIQQIDSEEVDERIAGLVNELRSIPTTVPPGKIEVARETFLEGLSVEDRDLVLNMERLPDDKFPLIQSLFKRFFRDYGGQVYQTAKEKALANRDINDYPPEALTKLQDDALQNANNYLDGELSKKQYDTNRTRYRAYFSGASTNEWREAMIEGAVARADIDKYMPESYQRSEELQAVSAYMEIQSKYIDETGGVLTSETWDEIEEKVLVDLNKHYSPSAVRYAIDHKDDWIDKLPEPARTVERERAIAIEDETWWDNYSGETTSKPTTASSTAGKKRIITLR